MNPVPEPLAAETSLDATADSPVSVAQYTEYGFASDAPSHTHRYLWPVVLAQLAKHAPTGRLLDAGCGNGAFCEELGRLGKYEVCGIDLSETGIAIAKKRPGATFKVLSVDDDIVQAFGGAFDAVVSLEVVEHLYSPADFVKALRRSVKPGGLLILTTPYHGYLKNLLLSATGKMDSHFTALWEGGHVKFWSRKTLSTLLSRHGFRVIDFAGCGRFPYLWKSMVLTAVRDS